MHMEKTELWTLFLETGAPEIYLMYRHAAEAKESGEKEYVS